MIKNKKKESRDNSRAPGDMNDLRPMFYDRLATLARDKQMNIL